MPKKKKLSKHRLLAFTREDAQDFTVVLLKEFPTMRFLIEDGQPPPKYDPFADERPSGLTLDYVAGLGGARSVIGWLEPQGYQPDWGPSENGRYWVNRNAPPHSFVYQSGHHIPPHRYSFPTWGRQKDKADDYDYMERCRLAGIDPDVWLDYTPPTMEGYEQISDGRIYAYYDRDVPEQKTFVNRVWRLLSRFATNYLTYIDLRTGEPFGPPDKGGLFWAGPHALEWARQKPNRFLEGNLKPADWYDDWLARQTSKGG